jgi:hypothetical protein
MSLLAAIHAGFADKPENVATRALAYILNRYPEVRKSWLNHFFELGMIKNPDLTIIDQRGTDLGRPDLQGRDASNKIIFLVEAKFDAGLTDNQPVGYLELLPSVEAGCLLFLVPSARLASLYSLCQRLCGAAITATRDCDIRLGNRTLTMQSWSSALNLMLASARQSGDDHAIGDLLQLKGLCDELEGDVFQPFSQEELTNLATPKLIMRLRSLIQPLVKACSEAGWTMGNSWECAGGRGANASLRRVTLYLQANSELWLRYKTSPLWLSVNVGQKTLLAASEWDAVVEALRSLRGGMCQGMSSDFYGALTIPPGTEFPDLLASVAAQMEEVRKKLVAAGLDDPPGQPT